MMVSACFMHVCQQYRVRHQSLFVRGGGERVLKDLGCVTIELDLIPPKTVQHSYDPINCQVIDSKFYQCPYGDP